MDAKEHLSGQKALDKVRSLLGCFRSAMLTNIVDGHVHTRPMTRQGKATEFDGSLWFFLDDRSDALSEIANGAVSTLILQSDSENAYLQLDGEASEDRDREVMERLYTPLVKTFFPDGLDDPHLTLLRFDVEHGSYWDSPGGTLQMFAAFAKSLATGERAVPGTSGDLDVD